MASRLAASLRSTGLDPDVIVEKFQEWKSGDPDDSYRFGHDSLGIGSKYLRHAHMVPVTVKSDLAAWDKAWRQFARRTSDRYLFYADGGPREGYFLIEIIDDPGAHAVWQQPVVVLSLEKLAEDFCVFGLAP